MSGLAQNCDSPGEAVFGLPVRFSTACKAGS